ncbi:hypothetical protein ACRAWB_04745 [Leifsonia poae]|uniref:hypothetical protein n=1 Tax=Leifsonia poae TaxID=110933 RepID=UPI003D697604
MTAARAIRLRREAWGFAIGSLLFLVGAVPSYQRAVGGVWTNTTFFVGALFFTAAAFIQLALSGRKPRAAARRGRTGTTGGPPPSSSSERCSST